MTKKVRAAFAMEPVSLRLDQVLPTRPFQEVVEQTSKYKAIAASVREVGIIEQGAGCRGSHAGGR